MRAFFRILQFYIIVESHKFLLQLLRLCMQKVEPLIEEGEEEFEGCFDEEIKEHEKDIDLGDTLRQISSYSDNRHK